MSTPTEAEVEELRRVWLAAAIKRSEAHSSYLKASIKADLAFDVYYEYKENLK
jgi:hypothetical protein